MIRRCLGALAVAAVSMVLAPLSANASPITWTLQSVIFADGGTASGSFAYDAAANVYSAISISTSATGGIPAALFQYKSIFGTAPSVGVFLDSNAANLTGFHDLTLRFSNNLTSAGGTSPLQLSSSSFETTCSNSQCGIVANPSSYITGGSVTAPGGTATPEPATLLLLPISLLGILTASRRSLFKACGRA